MEQLLFALLNGTIYGLLLFMLSGGLTLIFSMMGVLNFAHASFYMLGAYFAYSINLVAGFWVALLVAPVLVGVLGAVVERYGLRRVHARGPVAELLFTFGLAYVIDEVVKIIWGQFSVPYPIPAALDFPLFSMFGVQYPAYRIFMLFISLAMLGVLWLLIKRTRIGLIVQAALTHPQMVGHLGHDVPKVFMLVFATGCALAGLAGVIGGNYLVTEPGMAFAMGPIIFVVIVVGGLGSLEGAFIASLLIGILQTLAIGIDATMAEVFGAIGVVETSEFGAISVSQLAPMLPYILVVVVMIFRPRGLMGAREF